MPAEHEPLGGLLIFAEDAWSRSAACPRNAQAATTATPTSPTRTIVQITVAMPARNSATKRKSSSNATPMPAPQSGTVTVPALVSIIDDESQLRLGIPTVHCVTLVTMAYGTGACHP